MLSVAALSACSGGGSSSTVPSGGGLTPQFSNVRASCAETPATGTARCFALMRTDLGGGDPNGYHGIYAGRQIQPMRKPTPTPRPTSSPAPTPTPTGGPTPTPAPTASPTPAPGTPAGYGPADLQSAYALANESATKGAGQTIAIVDAYNDPTAESDLGVYRSQYGLSACTTANGCFKKVDQNGGTAYPATNTSC